MNPGGARDLVLGFTDTCPTLWTSLALGLLNSLVCTPGLWTPITPGLLRLGLMSSLDWTPGLLISMPPGLTPSLLLAGKLRGGPGRGVLDADCCTSEQDRLFMGVIGVTS